MAGMKFPRMHIAQSVINRILNTADGLAPNIERDIAQPVPDASKQGEIIDNAVTADLEPMSSPEGIEDAVLLKALDL